MNNIRNYGFITIALSLLLMVSCASSSEATGDNATAQKDVNIPEIQKKAGELFGQRDDLAKLREAVKTLAQARHADNRNYEVEWTYVPNTIIFSENKAKATRKLIQRLKKAKKPR